MNTAPNTAFARFLGKVQPSLQHNFRKRGEVYETFGSNSERFRYFIVSDEVVCERKESKFVGDAYERAWAESAHFVMEEIDGVLTAKRIR